MPSKRQRRTKTVGGAPQSSGTAFQPQTDSTGTLFLVPTPIGNLSDVTLRALEVLRTVDWIAAEDTRHTRKLLSHYQIHTKLISYHEHNARERETELLAKLDNGQSIALVSDAGTPGISDPGALLVAAAIAHGLRVEALPGPTAFLTALVASGLPPYPFAFLGFPPNRSSGRKRFFALHENLSMTLVFYESPQRLPATLKDMLEAWGDRSVVVARELTKLHEEIFRGSVSEALEYFGQGTKGEVTVVVSPVEPSPADPSESSHWREELVALMAQPEQTVKTASELVARRHRLPRRLVYQMALQTKTSPS
jgi:16S rRNA (cytidine1402-2'-O)-methyltransferase